MLKLPVKNETNIIGVNFSSQMQIKHACYDYFEIAVTK